jgi:hypothetical protein
LTYLYDISFVSRSFSMTYAGAGAAPS